MDEHEHIFEARYRLVNGKVEIDNPVKCASCDKLASLEYEGYRVIITLMPLASEVKSTITLEFGG